LNESAAAPPAPAARPADTTGSRRSIDGQQNKCERSPRLDRRLVYHRNVAHRIGLLLAAVGMSCGLGLACGGAGTTNKDASGGGGSPAGVGGSSGRGGGGLGSAGTGASAGGTATGGGGSGAGGVSGASGAAGDAGAAGGAGASGNGARGGGAGDAVGGTAGTIGGGGGATGNAGGRGGAAGSNGGRGGAAGNAGGGSGGSSGAGGSTGGGGRGGSAGTAGAAGAGAGSGGRGGGTAGAGGGGGQLAPPCAQTIIDLPGSAFSPPTLVPTNAGLHVVWMNADDNHRLQGGRIVGGAFTGGWTSTFAVSNATVPAAWNGTDLALTYSTRGDNNTVNLMTVAADGSISSGPFLLPGNPGLPVAIAWNGNEYESLRRT